MTTEQAIKLTVLFLALIILLVAAYDVFVYLKYGSEATISRVLYRAAADNPILGVLFGLSIGTLLGHLFWAQKIEPRTLAAKRETQSMKILKDYALGWILLFLFIFSIAGQYLTHDDSMTKFWNAVFENWQSEFLQVLVFVVLSKYFIYRGSPQSKE